MRNVILKLFSRSPFGPLQEHMRKSKECVDRLKPLLERVLEDDLEGAKTLAKEIFRLEHEADEIKNGIRDHLPRGLLLPVNRGDFVQLLKVQDCIPDGVEDLAGLLTVRAFRLPPELRPDLDRLVDAVLLTFQQIYEILERFDELLSASFGGSEAGQVLEMINELGRLEWLADKAQFTLTKLLFEHEVELDPVSVFLWLQVFRLLGQVANACENTGDRIRTMIAQ